MMSDPIDTESSHSSQKRVQPFLDCIAFLLAKRWLRDQRQQDSEKPPQERPELDDTPSEQ